MTWIVLRLGGHLATRAFTDLITVPVTFVVAFLCWRRGSQDVQVRRTWRLLSLGVLSWGIGEALWSYWELILHRTDMFPAPADAGFLGLIPLAAAALVSLPRGRSTLVSRVRTLLDGMLIAGSFLFLSWATVLGPTFRSQFDTLLAKAVGIAYPVGDVIIISTVLFVLAISRRSEMRRPLAFIAIGLIAIGTADSLLVWLSLHNAYSSGNPIDSVWDIGFLLIGLATLVPRKTTAPTVEESHRYARLGALLPYAGVALSIVTASVIQVTRGFLEPFLYWNAIAVLIVVLVRQLLTVLENVALRRGLESKVEERTQELKASEERFRSLVQNSFDSISVIVPPETTITFQTPSIQGLLGYGPSWFRGKTFIDLVHEDDRPHVRAALADVLTRPNANATAEVRLRHKEDRWCTVEVVMTNLLHEPSVRGVVLNARDITERKVLEEQLVHQAFTDGLTGLANSALFRDRVEHAVMSSDRDPGTLALLFIDLDGFKSVNDSLGHGAGDVLLRLVGEKITAHVRPGDTVARFGGDEFAVLLERLEDPSRATDVARRILNELKMPISLEGREVVVHASIGIAFRSGEQNARALMQDADVAMYSAKAHGKSRYEIFDNDMHRQMVERLALEGELDAALERGEFLVHYQPIVDVPTGRLVGMEALLRWNHPERGMISPAEFVPIAEDTGAIVAIGRWVIQQACRDASALRATSPHLYVSINLSPRQLQDPNIVMDVANAMAEARVSPNAVILEITEGMLIDDTRGTLDVLRKLKDLGVRLAVDDFGTGYSSLRYIRRFPVDVLKIDRSFVAELTKGPEEAALARAIVKLGGLFHLVTVAEGVETGDQLIALKKMGCDLAQGYLFGRPQPVDAIRHLVREAAAGERRRARERDMITTVA